MAVANGQGARPNDTGPTNKEEEDVWSLLNGDEPISLGVEVEKLKTSSPSTVHLPQLKTTSNHTVLTRTGPYTGNNPAADSSLGQASKTPRKTEDPRLWHPDFVKMPFSKKCQISTKNTRSKWNAISKALTQQPIMDFNDLEKTIFSYNDKGDMDGLKVFLNEHLDDTKRADFFDNILPKMTELVLQLPQLCSQPIPLLRKGVAHSVTLSQEQAACLLANAFFCTFPASTNYQKGSKNAAINFNRLYRSGAPQKTREKLKCLMHYFKTVTERMPQGNITYSRQVVTQDKLPKWQKCRDTFLQLHVSSGGTIEDHGDGMLQVDFANKYIGGGVLGEGCVQEEIRFVICPELLVSLLFTDVLDDKEAIVITGPQRYSKYTGYAKSFKWDGGYDDQTPRDGWGRRCTQLVAIDALMLNRQSNQFEASKVSRELNKAYVGFYDPYNQPHRTAVATGNWGCGAFGGDHRLKALIQLMAAAVAGRDVCYFTYKDNKLTQDISDIHQVIKDCGLTVADVWKYICDYSAYFGGSARGSTSNRGGNSYASSHDRAPQRQKNVFEFIQETATHRPVPSSGQVSKSRHTPPDPKDHNNVKTTRPNKNENDDDDEDTWTQPTNSAQNEATNENGSQRGAPAKTAAQKGAHTSSAQIAESLETV